MILPEHNFVHAFLGGTLIGLASLIGLLASGTIPGISGLFSRLLRLQGGAGGWRLLFFAGLIGGAALLFATVDSAAIYRPVRSIAWIGAAGVLVGFGTRLGGGCTSGHGICGIGLGSVRSIVATVVFMGAGVVTVWVFHNIGLAVPR
ncbi:MAG: YeeE/YedE thiosulfate transporter family protein [Opitutaceae bacterium]|jgi:uncharacterized membrane protein YedE/YeeE